MSTRLRGSLSVLGTALTLPWPIYVLASFATTCSAGFPDSWAFTLLIGTALTAVALPLLLLTRRVEGAAAAIRRAVPILTIPPLLLTLGHAIRTGVGGHSLCGADYPIVSGAVLLTRWYYPLMWAYALALSAAAMWPLVREWKRARLQPEPDAA